MPTSSYSRPLKIKHIPKHPEYHYICENHGCITMKELLTMACCSGFHSLGHVHEKPPLARFVTLSSAFIHWVRIIWPSTVAAMLKTLAHPGGAAKKSEHMGTQVLFIHFYFDVRCRELRVRMGFNSTRCFFDSYLRCQQTERATRLLSIQSKTGKAVNCMAPLPLALWSSLGILSASTPFFIGVH